MSLTTDANINDRFLIPPGSSITNIKNLFNDFVTQIQNSSFVNILKNSKLKEHFAGNPSPYAWNIDLGVTIDTSGTETVARFIGLNQEIAQPITEVLTPLDQYLLPSTEYLAIFDISPDHDCEVGVSYGAGLVNLLGSGAVSGSDYNALHSTVYGGSSGITYFVFKTAEDFSGVTFYIKNLTAGANAITLHKLSLVEGTLNLMDSIESNLFLDHIRYNDSSLKWEYTNDGITWQPFLEELNPSSTYVASYTPIHDQIPILSGTGGTQLAAGILPIGNGYLSPLVDLTIGGTGAIDLNTCTIAGVIYTTDGSVSIPNSPYDIYNGTAWWTGDIFGNGCQFAATIDGNLYSRTYNTANASLWSPWNLLTNTNTLTENLLINGNMDVWRRGGVASSFLLPNNVSSYTADRWKVSTAAHYTDNVNIFKDILQPVDGAYLVPGSRNAFNMYHPQLTADVTSSTRTAIEQRLEDVTRFIGQDITLSFWANSDTDMIGTVYVDVKPAGEANVAPFICNSGMKTPRSIAMDADYIYVANAGTPNITRYDIDTGTLDDTSGGSFVCNTHFSDIYGIAVDNSYIYVVNHGAPNVTRYNKATGAYDMTTGGAFSCSGGGDDAYIALDASYIYITNGNADTVTRYDIATGTAHPSGFSCTTTADVGGIAVDSTYIYIANISNNTVTRFTKSSGAAHPSGFSCTVGMSDPIGISVDASYIYVSNFNGNNVTKYNIANGTQVTSPTFACITAMNKPTGNLVTASYIYVLQSSNTGANKNSVTRYDIATGVFDSDGIPIASTVGFNCNAGMKHPNGLLSYGGYLYVTNRDTNTVTRYIKLNGVEDNTTGGAFLCNTGMSKPQDVTTDGTYLYVVNYTGHVSRHNLVTGALDMTTGGAFSCSTGGWYAYGIDTDGTYLYISSWIDQASTFVNKIKRFDIATGAVNATGFNCNTGRGPAGIAIYGAFIYVTNAFPETNTLTRYDLATGTRNTSGGFSCSAHMNWPQGVVTDGTYLYVVNCLGNTVTRYDIATGAENTLGFLCNTHMKSPEKIAIDTNFIYITNYVTNTVTRYGIGTGSYDTSGTPIPQISIHDYEQDIEFIPGVWQQYSVTFSIDVSAGIFSIDPTSPDFVAIGIIPNKSILSGTPEYNFSFTQAQLEYGTTASIFGVRPIAEEELLCQRFFQTSYLKDITPGTAVQQQKGNVNWANGSGTTYSLYTLLGYIPLAPRMRYKPTVTVYSPVTGAAGYVDENLTIHKHVDPIVYCSDGAITELQDTVGSSFNGELSNWYQFHYIADAEL